MRHFSIVLVAVIMGIAGLCLLGNFAAVSSMSAAASTVAGAPVHIGGFSLNIFTQALKLTGVTMYCPKGFPREIMLNIPLASVVCDVPELFTGKIHIKELVLNIKEIVLIKNKEGKLNVDSLGVVEPKKKGRAAQVPLRVDIAHLEIERVVNKDYSVSGSSAIKVYELNIRKKYSNITSADQLALLVVSEPLKAAGIKGLSIYGVSMLTGVAALPVAAAFMLAGKDHTQAVFDVSWARAFEAASDALREAGTVKSADLMTGAISGDVRGAAVAVKLKKIAANKTEVRVSARKLLLPQPEIAAGVVYRIADRVK